ncbi:M14 family zinc carboxypeptidase [Blattabacterium cuenoti]|uniref:M14 family zinc carboxypeptidase n=1 Tax=Blattabacterium cuenoti TaxID=1653831 RepID=UPI00163BD375|nr:M14 family zinc carboxypeptidase [Blattabacterium cuenoti]
MLVFDIKSIFRNYDILKDNRIIASKIFRYSKLLEMMKKYRSICSITPIGLSVEKRIIFKIKWGVGKIKVLIWSQMHGNETTGTKSIFDLLHFFFKNRYHDLIKFLFENLTILFIPMLNPDGSEKFQRRNAINIDLNRDAIRLQSPEIQVLFREIHNSKPYVLFNLHDQRSIYNIGNKFFNPAIISFLSPSIEKNEDSISRKQSMGIIYFMTKELKKILPNVGSVGRFSDAYYPTATGDNLQKIGYPCILLEAGNYPKDFQKEKIRKYNTLSILAGIYFISYRYKYLEKDYRYYFTIPKNKDILLDKIYRKVQILKGKKKYLIDIGLINFEKFDLKKNTLSFIPKIVDIGDLSNLFAYEDIMIPGQKFYGKNLPEIGDMEHFRIF